MKADLAFLYSSFMTFTAKNPVWILYFAALIYLLIRGGKDFRRIFIWPLIILGLTIFNPLVCGILVRRFSYGERYLRFFWVLDYYIVIAAAITLIVSRMHKKTSMAAAAAVLTLLVIVLGRPVFFGEDVPSYRLTPNASFVREDYPELRALLHEDGDEMPLLLCGNELMMTYRMYDPDVRILMTRTALYHLLSFSGAEDFEANSPTSPLTKILYRVYFFSDYSVDSGQFLYACHKRGIRFVVCKSDSTLNDYLAGNEYFLKKGEGGSFAVWRVLYPGEV